MEEKPSYYAVITADVRYDSRLKANEKLLYAEITALSQKNGYSWATDRYYANLFNVSRQSISSWLSNLEGSGYIKRKNIYEDGDKKVQKRIITIKENFTPPSKEKFTPPCKENFTDNITSINTTRMNKAQSDDMRTSHQNASNEQELKDNFDKLWKLYPNKKDKQRAFKAYKKAVKEGTANKDIQDGIVAYKKYVEQERANGFEQLKYKDGSTFFNGRNWEDEYPVKDSVSRPDISNSIAGLTANEQQNGEFMKLVNKFYGRSDFSGNKYTLAVIRKMYAHDRHE